MLTAFAWLAAIMAPCTHGCPYAGTLGRHALPRDAVHAQVIAHRRLRTAVPEEQYAAWGLPWRDPKNTSVPWSRMRDGDDFGRIDPKGRYGAVDVFSQMAKRARRDMCYWAMQGLPSPPAQFANGTVEWSQAALNLGDVRAVMSNGQEAYRRWVSRMYAGGPLLWAGCSSGFTNRRATCAVLHTLAGDTPTCNATFLNSATPWAVASIIVKINATNAEEVKALFQNWRNNSRDGHVPAMTSAQVVEKGWGYSGNVAGFTMKLVPCDLIPARYMYAAPGCDAMGVKRAAMDEALDVWGQACNAWKDEVASPNGGGCPRRGKKLSEPGVTS